MMNIHTGNLVARLFAALQAEIPARIIELNQGKDSSQQLPDIAQWYVGYKDILTDSQEGLPVAILRSDEHYAHPDTSHMERFACTLVVADKESISTTGWEHICEYEAIIDEFLRNWPRTSNEIVDIQDAKFKKGQSDGVYLCFIDFYIDVDSVVPKAPR